MINYKKAIIQFVVETMGEDSTGHDVFHAERVAKTAIAIFHQYDDSQTTETLSHCPVQHRLVLSSLSKTDWEHYVMIMGYLHDSIDDKFINEEEKVKRFDEIEALLVPSIFSKEVARVLIEEMNHLSYHKNKENPYPLSFAAQCVQDADWLDALGAIGIARTFAFGGKKGQALYDPDKEIASSLAHFHEKLYKLDEMMNTEIGREEAKKRIQMMKDYEALFLEEWEGKL